MSRLVFHRLCLQYQKMYTLLSGPVVLADQSELRLAISLSGRNSPATERVRS